MSAKITFALAFSTITLSVWLLLVGIPQINTWEKANSYPYGKLCDLYRNCR